MAYKCILFVCVVFLAGVVPACLAAGDDAPAVALVERDFDVRDLLEPIPAQRPVPDLNAGEAAPSPATRPAADRRQLSEELIAWAQSILADEPAEPAVKETDGVLHVRAAEATQTRIAAMLAEAIRRRNTVITVEIRVIESPPEVWRALPAELRNKIDLARLPAAGGQGVVLDESQCAQIIKAAQESPRGKIVYRPRLKMHDGQSGCMEQATLYPYVADIGHATVDGKEQAVPIIRNAEDGILVRVRASAAPDAVAMDLELQTASLQAIVPMPAPSEAGERILKPIVLQRKLHQVLSLGPNESRLYFLTDGSPADDDGRAVIVKADVSLPEE